MTVNDDDYEIERKKSSYPHNLLKEGVIHGFRDQRCPVEFAIYLLNNVISLEQMGLNLSVKVCHNDEEWTVEKWAGDIPEKEMLELLRKEAPSNYTAKILIRNGRCSI
ncbi:hypothetical protein CFOL_v3_07372 [Cephalotus follicularis]|uniref:FBD domain-containing protein n=1 Tax=Cephalotus follicularis TaxID=3775 RepID=A0A1Q3B7N0_CEPFO|nr:hypothetical protein CFOL_v3_07372 [Cephalotus follicularis]